MRTFSNWPLLSATLWIPLIGALFIVFLIPKTQTKAIKWFAFWIAIVDMIASLLLLPGFDASSYHMQFTERVSWIPSIGAEYYLGIDGISLLLIVLTTILTAISVLCSFAAIEDREKEYYVSLLLLSTGMLGVFMALDFFLFYVFWEVMLVPMYFLIGIWGGARRLYAAIKFFLYTLFGSVFLLLGILTLYFLHGSRTGIYTFDILALTQMQVPLNIQYWLFGAFFLAFAIKVPMVPFHTWLPDAHVEAPTAGSVILAGVLLKMGTYGFVRFSLPMFPEASREFALPMAVLAIVGILYGAFVTLAQKDLKKLIAYSSVSHLGFVMLGIFCLNPQGLMGALLQNLNHGITTSALFLIVGIVYERRHTREIAVFGGLAKPMPVFAVIFAVTALSSLGLPGLNNFIGEFLIVAGAFKVNFWYALATVIGIILGAAYLLWLYQRMMFGPLDKPGNAETPDVNRREVFYMTVLILFMFWIGVYPKPTIHVMDATVAHLADQVRRAAPESARQLRFDGVGGAAEKTAATEGVSFPGGGGRK